MISHHLLPYILHPSRVTDHSATVIDNIFSNNTEYDTFSGNILTNISDHFPQFLVINKATIKDVPMQKETSNFSENKFVSDYSKIDNEFSYDPDISLSSKFYTFYKNLSSSVDRHVPTKKMTKKDIKFHSKPWISTKIKKLMKHRDRLKHKLNRKYTLDNEYLYKKFRNRVVNELRASRISYYNKYFTEHKNNMKMLWSGIRSIINVKNARLNNILQIVQDGKIISNLKEIAQSFNQYFVNVASNIDKDIPRTKKCPFDYLGNRSSASFFVSPTDRNEVKNIISQLQTGKSVGPNSIPINLLKMLSPVIVSPLVILINKSFSTRIFPAKLKIAKVVALHKKAPLAILLIIDLFHFCLSLVKYLKNLCIKDYIIF